VRNQNPTGFSRGSVSEGVIVWKQSTLSGATRWVPYTRKYAPEVPHTAEESLDKAGLKKGAHVLESGAVVDPNGEIIPGVRVETRENKLIYTIPEAPDA